MRSRKKPTDMGLNRTGLATSPIDAMDLIQASPDVPPDVAQHQRGLKLIRGSYITGAEPIGTMPPPASLTEAVASLGSMLTGKKATVLTDKLGARLAFERTGTRLYEALIQKFRTLGASDGGPSIDDLMEHRNDELHHFDIVRNAIIQLGGDPTVQTPAADVSAVMSQGILQVVLDPRTTRTQCLEAILVAENADTEGWGLLVELMRELGSSALAAEFAAAMAREEEHTIRVRTWLAELSSEEGGALVRPATRVSRVRKANGGAAPGGPFGVGSAPAPTRGPGKGDSHMKTVGQRRAASAVRAPAKQHARTQARRRTTHRAA